MPYIELFHNQDDFQAFPDPKTVFASDTKRYLEFLLPLATISLSRINQDWRGKIHFVLPMEPFGGEKSGVVGSETEKYHTYLCRPNWIGYHINDQGQYTLAADFHYFLNEDLDHRDDVSLSEEALQELKEVYALKRKSYTKNKKHFQEFGALHQSFARRRNGKYSDDSRLELTQKLGGFPGWGNWASATEFPLTKVECVDEEGDPCTSPLPVAEDGSRFEFIGSIPAYSYVDEHPCNLLLFYHPEQQLALTTFDWS
ncbi:hypothetical protein Pan153_43000 [Gimesia panareensis]|uniref:Uncharacterized protein n=1 Tax=Gimesia panareensis TaxID=2527978 RepID=A0A518FTG7_9PLAN|nr:hypothetical protein [Gimesia panareensis]QDV19634.1 hypothetical protein Pan153_43000 [Gimesia panareensis]